MYSQIDLQIICNSRCLTEVFQSQLGVFQGDNLSPNLFNIFVNDLFNCFDETCMPVALGELRINCLKYADDLIILSETASGLQKCLKVVGKFCSTWGLIINYIKSKIMFFSKSGIFFYFSFIIYNIELECVREYKYFGIIIISFNGSFTRALYDLYHRGQNKKKGKYQESIQSSTTPGPGYQWESDNFTIRYRKREPSGQPFPSR